MGNRDKLRNTIQEYINDMNDRELYKFISEQDLSGPNVFGCIDCEAEHGDDGCDEPGICEKRFLEWIDK